MKLFHKICDKIASWFAIWFILLGILCIGRSDQFQTNAILIFGAVYISSAVVAIVHKSKESKE